MSKSMGRVSVLATVALLSAACFTSLVLPAQAVPVNSTMADVLASPTYKLVQNIQEESSTTRKLTDGQLATLDTYVNSPDMLMRLQVIIALRHADPKHIPAAIAIARKGLTSGDGMTRAYALNALDSLNAPDIVALAKSLASERGVSVLIEARRILTKRGVKN